MDLIALLTALLDHIGQSVVTMATWYAQASLFAQVSIPVATLAGLIGVILLALPRETY